MKGHLPDPLRLRSLRSSCSPAPLCSWSVISRAAARARRQAACVNARSRAASAAQPIGAAPCPPTALETARGAVCPAGYAIKDNVRAFSGAPVPSGAASTGDSTVTTIIPVTSASLSTWLSASASTIFVLTKTGVPSVVISTSSRGSTTVAIRVNVTLTQIRTDTATLTSGSSTVSVSVTLSLTTDASGSPSDALLVDNGSAAPATVARAARWSSRQPRVKHARSWTLTPSFLSKTFHGQPYPYPWPSSHPLSRPVAIYALPPRTLALLLHLRPACLSNEPPEALTSGFSSRSHACWTSDVDRPSARIQHVSDVGAWRLHSLPGMRARSEIGCASRVALSRVLDVRRQCMARAEGFAAMGGCDLRHDERLLQRTP